MLNFLSNHKEQKRPLGSRNAQPSITFGISIEAPEQFQKPYTMISKNTYVNPYLPFDQRRLQHIPNGQSYRISPTWTRKIDINQIQQQKILGRIGQNQQRINRYSDSYTKELKKNHSRFKRTKGEFTNFIHLNSNYQSIAPLQGERTLRRALDTKRTLLQKSQESINQYTIRNNSISKLQNTMETKCPIQLSGVIRTNRQRFHNKQLEELELRKKTKINLFMLPKIFKRQEMSCLSIHPSETIEYQPKQQ